MFAHVSTISLFMLGDVLSDLSPLSASTHKRWLGGCNMDFIHAKLVCRRADPAIIPKGFWDRIKMLRKWRMTANHIGPNSSKFRIVNIAYGNIYSTNVTYTYLWPISVFIPISGLIVVANVCILLPIVPVRFCPDAGTQ